MKKIHISKFDEKNQIDTAQTINITIAQILDNRFIDLKHNVAAYRDADESRKNSVFRYLSEQVDLGNNSAKFIKRYF